MKEHMLDIDAAFAEIVKENSQGFGHDRQKTIGSSEIGACALRIGRRKLGVAADKSYKDSGGFAMRGNVMEDHVCVPILRRAIEKLGGRLLYAGQKDQLSLVNKKAKASATPDGLAVGVPRDALAKYGVKDLLSNADANEKPCFLIELKSIDPRKNMDKLPDPKHVDQVNYALGLFRSYKEDYVPDYALLIYTDASDYSKITPFTVKFDEDGFMGQLARAKHLFNAVDAGPKAVEALRPEGKVAGGKECKTCEFAAKCLGYAPMVPRVVQKASLAQVKQINKIAITLKDATEQKKQWVQHEQETTAELKEALAKVGTKFIETDVLQANWKVSDGRSVWDAEAMAKKLTSLGIKNVEKKFKKTGKPSESLSVKFVNALAS